MSNNEYNQQYGGQFSAGVNYDDGSKSSAGNPHNTISQQTNNPKPQPGLLDLGTAQAAEPVKDITTDQFMAEVIEASNTKPVLVDFWAPWCGPCKQLGPAIESAVTKTGGKVKLVKMNIDDHPEIAGQMGIQSIPAVVAFVSGQPKDAFMGAKSESEISRFIEKLAGPSEPSKLEQALDQASQLAQNGQEDEASAIYSAILSQQPENADALAGYGMLLLQAGQLEEAQQVHKMGSQHEDHQGLDALAAAIELAQQADALGDFDELEAKIADQPDDFQARLDLAIALNGAQRKDEAAQHLLYIIARDRQWQDDGARTQLLKFFESWGPTDPATLTARRRLSSLLFA